MNVRFLCSTLITLLIAPAALAIQGQPSTNGATAEKAVVSHPCAAGQAYSAGQWCIAPGKGSSKSCVNFINELMDSPFLLKVNKTRANPNLNSLVGEAEIQLPHFDDTKSTRTGTVLARSTIDGIPMYHVKNAAKNVEISTFPYYVNKNDPLFVVQVDYYGDIAPADTPRLASSQGRFREISFVFNPLDSMDSMGNKLCQFQYMGTRLAGDPQSEKVDTRQEGMADVPMCRKVSARPLIWSFADESLIGPCSRALPYIAGSGTTCGQRFLESEGRCFPASKISYILK